MSAALYLDRLSREDLLLLAEAAGERDPASAAAELRSDPTRIPSLLERPEVFQRLFRSRRDDPLLFASPFLAFSVLLARAAAELREERYVAEWIGPRRWVPVFDVAELRAFAEDELRRLFLADLLASYTRVTSGVVWMRTPTGWSRRRFSELDPGHLAQLILSARPEERLALYRRLGDLALFLTGVFPDHVGGRLLGPVRLGRIERALGVEVEEVERAAGGPVALLEELGRRSYRMAAEGTEEPRAGMARVLHDLVERFREARRILNFVTERYLFPVRERWFGAA